jgi:hypothetical protein
VRPRQRLAISDNWNDLSACKRDMKYIGSKHQRENKQNSDNMHNVQDYSVLYNNTVRPFICEG